MNRAESCFCSIRLNWTRPSGEKSHPQKFLTFAYLVGNRFTTKKYYSHLAVNIGIPKTVSLIESYGICLKFQKQFSFISA